MKTGVLGGTFDPVHRGHTAIAATAADDLGLDRVLFVPTAVTPLKEAREITPAVHRIEMVRLACAGYPRFELSTIEADRPGVSYTVDTLRRLRREMAPDDELFFIVGADSLMHLGRWREPEAIMSLCRLVALPRPGTTVPAPAVLEAMLPGLTANLTLLEGPWLDISATEIRRRVRAGLPVDELVPAPVGDYIRRNGLYRD